MMDGRAVKLAEPHGTHEWRLQAISFIVARSPPFPAPRVFMPHIPFEPLSRQAHWTLAALAIVFTFGDVLIQELHGTAAFYAALSREMLTGGDWLAPFQGPQAYLLKPPLAFWLSAASSALLGINDFAMTLPSRLAGLGCVLMTYLLGRRYYGPVAGWFAALILPTNGIYIQFTTNFRMDSLMTLGGLLILWGYLNLRNTRGMAAIAHGLVLSVLTKGPMIFAMLGVFVLHAAGSGQPLKPPARAWRWLALLLLPLAWFGWLWLQHGAALSSQLNHDFWRGDTALGLSALDSALLEYLFKPLRRLWPWVPLLVAGVAFGVHDLCARGRSRIRRWDLALLLGLFAINYGIAAVKPDPDVRYLYPSLPLVAILAGGLLAALCRDGLPRAVLRGAQLLLLVGIVYAGVLSVRGYPEAKGLAQMRALAEDGILNPDNAVVLVDYIPDPTLPRRNDPLPDSLYYYLGFVPKRVALPLASLSELPTGTRYVLIRRKRNMEATLSALGLSLQTQAARISLFKTTP